MEKLLTCLSTAQYWEGASNSEKRTIWKQAGMHVTHNNILYHVGSDKVRREMVTSAERAKEIPGHNHSLPSGGHGDGIGPLLRRYVLSTTRQY